MTIPRLAAIELPLLREIDSAGGSLRPIEAYDALLHYFPDLTEADLQLQIPSQTDNKWQNLVRWTRQTLKERGEIDGSIRGTWRITPRGRRRIGNRLRQVKTINEEQASYAPLGRQLDPMKRKQIEEAAVARAMEWERSQGRHPSRVDTEKRGYDIESKGRGEVRYIEVKGLSGSGPVEMTANEVKLSESQTDSYYLYVLTNALDLKAKLYVVRNPGENCARVPSTWAVFWQDSAAAVVAGAKM